MKKDIYSSYIGAKGVVFAWIGAALGPIFLLIGITENSFSHGFIGSLMLVVVLLSIKDGREARKAGVNSDFWVLTIVPIAILFVGIALAFLSYRGHI
ncbi:hypothetical protein [Microbulbifer celer]|uniref:DUF805 domain-containing protein n=1 Tax=Microbulbifer celer TaxID=435905 RepID=A0ABW3UB22_9GAMM|nr:hypothetical protein [Microbulbifer celer]UFN58216.1 hypothetical protein LPW13_04000 [Microbulbifer celer]